MTLVILCNFTPTLNLEASQALPGDGSRREGSCTYERRHETSPKGSDWTRLLTDPDLVSHLGRLLQTYREVPAEQREGALLRTMREIKEAAVKARAPQKTLPVATAPAPTAELQRPEPVDETPPFEPDLLTPQFASDRRRFQRIKCYVAVEIHVEGVGEPVWGNLAIR